MKIKSDNTKYDAKWAEIEKELDKDVERFVAARNELRRFQDAMQNRQIRLDTLSYRRAASFKFFEFGPLFRACRAS